MTPALGLLAAFVTFLSWGFGDFFIQRTSRQIGSLQALFFITALGAIVLSPFAAPSLAHVFRSTPIIRALLLAACSMFAASLANFEALRKGRIAVIEAIVSAELPIAAVIGIVLLGERVAGPQRWLIAAIFVGILLTVSRRTTVKASRSRLEAGTFLAVISAIGLAVGSVATGLASHVSSPIVAIWFIHTSIAVILTLWFILRRQLLETIRGGLKAWRPTLAQSVLDNVAWVSYAAAVLVLPISLTVALTESYVALAAILGILVNRERFQRHQYTGIGLTIAAAIALAALSA